MATGSARSALWGRQYTDVYVRDGILRRDRQGQFLSRAQRCLRQEEDPENHAGFGAWHQDKPFDPTSH